MSDIDIVYLKKEILDGELLVFIKKDYLGEKHVFIKDDIGEVVSLGKVEDLEREGYSE